MGNSPGWATRYTPTSTEWNEWFASKQDDLGGHYVTSLLGLSGDVTYGQLTAALVAAGTTINDLSTSAIVSASIGRINYLDLQKYGVGTRDDGAADNVAALASLKAAYPTGVLRLTRATSAVYLFSTIPDFSGLHVTPDDPNITVYSPSGNLSASMTLTRPLTVKFLSAASVPYYDHLDPRASATAVEMRSYLAPGDYDRTTRRALNCATDLEYMSWAWPGDVATTSATSAAATYVSWSFSADAAFHYARPKTGLRAGEELVCNWQEPGNYLRSILIETSGGVHILTEDGSGNATYYYKPIGGSAVTLGIDWTGHASHNSYKFQYGQVGVRVITQNSFAVTVNGVTVLGPITALGTIENVGFGVFSTSGSFSVSVLGWIVRRGGQFGGVLPFTLGVIGDSRSYDHYGAWPYYARQNLEFFRGIRCLGIDNRAVPGEGSGAQLARLLSVGIGQARVWVVSIITNDIQFGTPIGAVGTANSVVDNMSQIFTFLKNAGCPVLYVAPFLWYQQGNVQSVIGTAGYGQASAGYANGAPYYAAVERLCISMGVPMLDGREVYGQIVAELLAYDAQILDPAVNDNIHPTNRANEVMGRAVARTLATVLTPEPTLEIARGSLPSAYFANGWTSQADPNLCTGARDKAGYVTLAGLANAGTLTAGTVIYTLPTYFRPAARREIVAQASGGPVRLMIDTNGQISLPATITGTWVSLACSFSID